MVELSEVISLTAPVCASIVTCIIHENVLHALYTSQKCALWSINNAAYFSDNNAMQIHCLSQLESTCIDYLRKQTVRNIIYHCKQTCILQQYVRGTCFQYLMKKKILWPQLRFLFLYLFLNYVLNYVHII